MISTYAQLRQALLDWSKRSDTLSLLDTFIAMAESDMYAMPYPYESLRIRDMEQTDTTTTGITDRFVPLPDNYIELRRVALTTSQGEFWLDQKTPFNMHIRPDTGLPHFFTVTDTMELDIVPDLDYPLTTLYFGKLTPLSATDTTNAILDRFPSIYLHGALRHLFQWARDQAQADYYLQQFAGAIQGANRGDQRGRYGPAPVIRMTGPTP